MNSALPVSVELRADRREVVVGGAVQLPDVGREPGVRHVPQGSVQQAGQALRISVHLLEADTGRASWSERFTGETTDIFRLQDRLTESVAAAIEPTLRSAEALRARETAKGSARPRPLPAGRPLDALHREACRLQPRLRLLKSGTNDELTLTYAGHALAYLARGAEIGLPALRRAGALNPGPVTVPCSSGWLHPYVGAFETALADIERALRLNPPNPNHGCVHSALGRS